MQRAVGGNALQDELAGSIAPAIRAIGASIGPDARHVLYANGNLVGTAATGSEIARRVCSDHFAARLLKDTLMDVERDLGDGTARTAVMAAAALACARRGIAGGAVPERILVALTSMRPALDEAFADECAEVADLVAVGIGAGAEPGLSELLSQASDAVGSSGFVEVLERHEPGAHMTLRQGFGFNARVVGGGSLVPMGQVHLIVANEVLRDFRSLAPVIEGFAQSHKSLMIASRGLEDQALQLIERNRKAGILKVVAVVPADAGPRAADILEDLALATGAVLVSDHAGTCLDSMTPAMLGRAEGLRHDGTLVNLIGAAGDAARIAPRLREIEAEIAAKRYLPLDREHAARRHARLAGHWAEVRIGARFGATEAVNNARRAIAAIRSARLGGVIDGGGRGLDRIAARLEARPTSDVSTAVAQAMLTAALRASGICLRHNSGQADALRLGQVADPARLSRSLLDVALSLAGRLAGIEGAIIRH